MDRLRSVPLLLVLALLFPLGASMPIACCAGVAAGAHSQPSVVADHCAGGAGGCCDRAEEDAAARHCCAGGDAFERPQSPQRPMPDADAGPAAVHAAAWTAGPARAHFFPP